MLQIASLLNVLWKTIRVRGPDSRLLAVQPGFRVSTELRFTDYSLRVWSTADFVRMSGWLSLADSVSPRDTVPEYRGKKKYRARSRVREGGKDGRASPRNQNHLRLSFNGECPCKRTGPSR